MSLAAVEAGGTKFRAAEMDLDLGIVTETRIATKQPDETLEAVIAFFAGCRGRIGGLGIGSFGPLDLRKGSPTFGSLMATPKPGWSGAGILDRLAEALGAPARIDTDVGAAALAEASLGAGADVDSIVYVTVGTGIGGAALAGGEVWHGHGHSELGHLPVERRPGDRFEGSCPFHGDCLEGMASGFAVEERREAGEDPADRYEAAYLAQLVRALTYTFAPERVVFGGGLFQSPELLPAVRAAVTDDLGGYSTNPDVAGDVAHYVVTAGFGQDAGLVGAGLLARRAAEGTVNGRGPAPSQ